MSQQQHKAAGAGPSPHPPRDWWITLGLMVSAASAAVSSFDGLRNLTEAAGWSPAMALLWPLTVDALAMTATRVWLADSVGSAKARSVARLIALGAICISLAGNATWHLIAAQLVPINWIVVVAVGAFPPLSLALVAHLAVLRKQPNPSSNAVLGAGVRSQDGPHVVLPEMQVGVQSVVDSADQPPGEDVTVPAKPRGRSKRVPKRRMSIGELLVAAHTADEQYRRQYGRGITRDALRKSLRVGGDRATELLRRLKAESLVPP